MKTFRNDTGSGGRSAALAGVFAAALLAAPVMVGLGYTVLGALGFVGPGSGGGSASLDRFSQVLSDPAVWEGTLWTLWVAGASTLLATVGAAGVAAVFRGSGWTARAGRGVAFLPLPVPHLAAGVGLMVCPYVVPNVIALAVVGVLLIVAPFVLARF